MHIIIKQIILDVAGRIMAKQYQSDTELEKEEGEGEEEEVGNPSSDAGISEYEKQRLSRIAENKARMEALGLRTMASSLMGSAHKSSQPRKSVRRRGKGKAVDDDDDADYRPDDLPEDDQDDDFDDDEDDEDFVHIQSSSKPRTTKVKNRISKPKKKVPIVQSFENTDNEDDDDLMQAIALSLQDSVEDATLKESKQGNGNIQEDAERRKRKKLFNNRVQMTEDEVVLHFFQFDEAGRGFLAVRDLQRVAIAHDFIWTDRELADMIHCFDSDSDGKEGAN